jgi:uroporphyrinogen-III synthase
MSPRAEVETPLKGARILVTRAREDTDSLRLALEPLGAEVLSQPTIAVGAPANPIPLDSALRGIATFDWIAFTSRYAVRAVFERLSTLGGPGGLPGTLRVAAVGASTATELHHRDVASVLVPSEPSGSALATAMQRAGVEGRRVLLPAGDLARPELRQGLIRAGAEVVQVVAYRTVVPDSVDRTILDALCGGKIDVVAFASPSAIRNLVAMLGPDSWCLHRTRIACIGDTTAQAIEQHGFRANATGQTGLAGLVDAIVGAYKERQRDHA